MFANVGACASPAIAATSANCSRIPRSNAGRKSSSRIRANGGNS